MRGRKRRVGKRVALSLALTALVVFFVLLASGAALAGPPWTDAPNSWWVASYDVTDTQAATVADGYPDGTFRPAVAVNRAQFAKMVVEGMGVATTFPLTPSFSDVPVSYYFYPWIEGGVSAGIISGFGDGTFRPTSSIIRQQADSILGSYLAQKELNLRGHIAGHLANYPSLNTWYTAEGVAILGEFADGDRVASVHAPATAYLIFKGVVQGSYADGWMYLGPNQDLTRAQAVALILRVQAVTFPADSPTVTLLSPSGGTTSGGTPVTITGTNFVSGATVAFGTGYPATSVVVVNSTTITCVSPAHGAGAVDVTVTTPAGTSATTGTANDYTYVTYGVPAVAALNPTGQATTAAGTLVTITGTNFVSGATVRFGTSSATSVVVVNSTTITCFSPAHAAGVIDVTVTTPGGTSSTTGTGNDYTYGAYGLPTVAALSPTGQATTAAGTLVTITGTNFVLGATVAFGTGYPATSVVVWNSTTITCYSPAHAAGTVNVTVTTPAGTSSTAGTGNDYTYGAYGIPTVDDLSPAGQATTAAGTLVTITGTNFVLGATVAFGGPGYPATSVVVWNSTTITCYSPAHAVGTVNVTVTTPAGTSSILGAGNDYTYGAYGIPTVDHLSPIGQATTAAGTPVTISGTNFVAGATVAFGGTPATSVHVWDSTTITCVSPAHAAGTVDVTVHTPAGTSSILGTGNDYTYGSTIVNIHAIPGVTPPVTGATPVSTITATSQYTGTVTWAPAHNPFSGLVVYTATITLTAKPGYTLTGVAANFFTVAGATTVTNLASSGVVTAVFPATGVAPTVVNIPGILGVTPPVTGETPVTTITASAQYTGTVTWSPASNPFTGPVVYTATITLTANPGFTFAGVGANFFTVAGATATNAANSGVVTAVFPATAAPTVVNIPGILGVTAPVIAATPVSTITVSTQYTGTVTWSPAHNPFNGAVIYTATITLTAKPGYTLAGVGANFFTVAGATATNAANSGVVTAVFPATAAPTVVNIPGILGVTAPVIAATPVSTITVSTQYTGTVTWSPAHNPFNGAVIYTATITLTAKPGYTLAGVAANFFTVAGATATNAVNSGVVTAVFPATAAPTVIDIAAILGVTPPATGDTPVTTITVSTQYTGTVTWSPSHNPFNGAVIYTATITLTAKPGYTLAGVGANFFTVAGATATNAANSGVVTAVFPATAAPTVVNIPGILGVTAPVIAATPVSTITVSTQYTGTVTWSPAHNPFNGAVIYTATITLTAKPGYTLAGVGANFFTVAGATATNAVNSGVVTAVFPATAAPTVVNIAAILGVTPPITGDTPVTTITVSTQYTGTVTWSPSHNPFTGPVIYTATITLTAKPGYTLTGVGLNFFTVAGATATNAANSGVVTAVFPVTAAP